MEHKLFIEIEKFNQWAKANYNIPEDEIGGEWECNYTEWQSIYSAFEVFINEPPPKTWDEKR